MTLHRRSLIITAASNALLVTSAGLQAQAASAGKPEKPQLTLAVGGKNLL